MSTAATRRRLNEAISALHRFAGSRKLDPLHADRAGVDLNLAAYGVLGRIVEHGHAAVRRAEIDADCLAHGGYPLSLSYHELRLLPYHLR